MEMEMEIKTHPVTGELTINVSSSNNPEVPPLHASDEKTDVYLTKNAAKIVLKDIGATIFMDSYKVVLGVKHYFPDGFWNDMGRVREYAFGIIREHLHEVLPKIAEVNYKFGYRDGKTEAQTEMRKALGFNVEPKGIPYPY